jgi:RimJ/RimL family protein N-acetyltransferase
VRGIIALAFDEYGFEQVIAKTDADNSASRALCERIGMQLLSISTSTDGRNVPECTYALRRT